MGLVFDTFARDLIALLVILVSLAWYYVHHAYGHWQRKGLFHLAPSFPFGNLKETFLVRKSFGEQANDLYNASDKPMVGIWAVFKPTLLVRDPEIVRQIFIKDFNTFPDRGIYCDEDRDPLSATLFAMPGEKWRRLRNQLSPTFTSGKLKAMFSTIVDCGGSLDSCLSSAATKGESIEVRELLASYTTNIIASVAFGIEIDCIADPSNSFRKYGRMALDPSVKNAIRAAFNFYFPKIFPWTGLRAVDAEVEEFIVSVVRKNIELRESSDVSRKDFFQLLLQVRNSGAIQDDDQFGATVTSTNKTLSINECAAQAFVFFLAGFETSSTTMSFALYELTKNKDCLRRVQAEIDEVLAKYDGQLTYDSVAEMKYLDWCIDESLRMYPPVPILNRESSAPWTIPNTNITIEKGTPILIPAQALQNDPKYWPEPEKFIPERFSPEQSAGHSQKDRPYMPFGDGPRNCIGMRLGKLQTKAGLIVMLQKYNYELAGSSKLPLEMIKSAFVPSPVGGVNLKITHRMKK